MSEKIEKIRRHIEYIDPDENEFIGGIHGDDIVELYDMLKVLLAEIDCLESHLSCPSCDGSMEYGLTSEMENCWVCKNEKCERAFTVGWVTVQDYKHVEAENQRLRDAAKPFVDQLRGTAIENYKPKQGFNIVLHRDHSRPPNLTGKDFRALAEAVKEE